MVTKKDINRKLIAYLKTMDATNNYIFRQIDLARSKCVSYAIDSASNKFYLIQKKNVYF